MVPGVGPTLVVLVVLGSGGACLLSLVRRVEGWTVMACVDKDGQDGVPGMDSGLTRGASSCMSSDCVYQRTVHIPFPSHRPPATPLPAPPPLAVGTLLLSAAVRCPLLGTDTGDR